jgi:adenylate cyclase
MATEQTRDQLHQLLSLRSIIDDVLEECQQQHKSLSQTTQRLLPTLQRLLGASAIFLQTYNEELQLTLYTHPLIPKSEALTAALEGAGEKSALNFIQETDQGTIIAQPLDVAGKWFGCLGVIVARDAPLLADSFLHSLLKMACEEIDHFVASIYEAREKHQLIMRLSNALRSPVLDAGLQDASTILCKALSLQELLVVYRADKEDAPPQVHLWRGEEIQLGFKGIYRSAQTYLDHNDRELLSVLQLNSAQEEVLIAGNTRQMVIGRIVATSPHREFCTFDRDLIASFAELLRQRLVDYGKEWRQLAESFCPPDATRLLSYGDYAKKFLSPQEAEIAIVYADIAGFTRVSEQILKTPAAVSALVEAWSREAVRLVWEAGGVFDKMVGDCIIALFGPPFYAGSASERLTVALQCSVALRDMTRGFHKRPELTHLSLPELGVAIGVNLAPVMVGYFGPNSNFTCFSSGMNNTSRLQGCAVKHEILVMSEALQKSQGIDGLTFGEERSALVKNVAEPLRFKPLL